MHKVDMMPDTLTQVMVVKGLKLNKPQKENMVTRTEESCELFNLPTWPINTTFKCLFVISGSSSSS